MYNNMSHTAYHTIYTLYVYTYALNTFRLIKPCVKMATGFAVEMML